MKVQSRQAQVVLERSGSRPAGAECFCCLSAPRTVEEEFRMTSDWLTKRLARHAAAHAADHRGGGSVSRASTEWLLQDEARRIDGMRVDSQELHRCLRLCARRLVNLPKTEFHHPDISFGWGYLRSRGDENYKINLGLHENDFIMAAKLDQLAGKITAADKRDEQ